MTKEQEDRRNDQRRDRPGDRDPVADEIEARPAADRDAYGQQKTGHGDHIDDSNPAWNWWVADAGRR